MTVTDLPAPVVGALSPSRASDFLTCPLLYRFRVLDKIPERPSPVAVRGTVVHAVLERLYDLPATERTLARAMQMIEPEWRRLLDAEPELAGLFCADDSAAAGAGEGAAEGTGTGAGAALGAAGAAAAGAAAAGAAAVCAAAAGAAAAGAAAAGAAAVRAGADDGKRHDTDDGKRHGASEHVGADVSDVDDQTSWLAQVGELVQRYFALEDPRRLEPAEREFYVETELEGGLVLRGYVDRLDLAPATGDLRIVDYKTGKAPGPGFEARAMFQMRCYALVLWRLHGRVPRLLQLLYLGSGEILRYEPDEADLRATERKLLALWAAIQRAMTTGDWRPRPSRLCEWCDHRARCPAFGGTPPPLPVAPAQTPLADEPPPPHAQTPPR